MSEVARFSCAFGEMGEDDSGDWVDFEDYQALQAENVELRTEVVLLTSAVCALGGVPEVNYDDPGPTTEEKKRRVDNKGKD